MQQVLQQFGRNVPLEDVELCLEKLDHNKDGKVDLEASTAYIHSLDHSWRFAGF